MGTVNMSQYVTWSMYDTVNTIEAYLNSKHISGQFDSQGREKPFFDIVTAAANIWFRATDLDRKNILLLAARQEQVPIAFIANVLLQNWMKEEKFGMFLNEWGRTLSRCGSAVVKFVEKDGKLIPSVIPWTRLIPDAIDFDALPRIEKFYRTPEQLSMEDGYDKAVVKALINAQTTRKTQSNLQKDTQSEFIELYEVHGQLPTYLLENDIQAAAEGEEDADFCQQMHVVSFMAKDENKEEYDEFTLYKGRERKDPYMITHLIPEDGRTLAIGAVEHCFESQWMVNHTQKNVKDTLDLASMIIMQTADGSYVGRNVLSALQTGDILVHADNKPLTRVGNDNPSIAAFQSFGQQWMSLSREITSTPDAQRGNTLPSGTPYAQAQLLSDNSSSLFEMMTENKGLYLEEMMREYVIPHLMKKLNHKDEIVALLDENQITELEAMYVPRAAVKAYNEQWKEDVLNEELPDPFQKDLAEAQVRESMAPMGSKRSFKPDEIGEKSWKTVLKDFDMTVSVEITDENKDKKVVLATLSSMLDTIGKNPQILQDQTARLLFSQIMQETGRLSPIQLPPITPILPTLPTQTEVPTPVT